MATITLKYQKNQSHEIRVEKLNINYKSNKWDVQETSSFFMDEYKEAIEMVNAIIALCNGKKEDEKRNGSATKESESINNRILFVGQRGTGKTSAMTSFAKGLDDAIENGRTVFKRLPMIDPSNFDNNTNILLTVITMMFSEAKELMKKNDTDGDVITKREDFLERFDEVFKSLKAITGSDKPTFTLEGLNEKSRALQMRTGMHGLVKSYIEFYNKVKGTSVSRLVLQIDDIDMTVSHVPEMLEQMRKYLDLDNLLILMSANLGQLYNEMREHYSKSFKETLNDRNQALSIDVEDLANKYLLKLFPTSRRIRVEHSVNQLLNTVLEVDDNRPNTPKYYNVKLSEVEGSVSNISKREDERFEGNLESTIILNNNPGGKEDNNTNRLQNVILSLIWKKTRLLFASKDTKNVLHPIIPTNLRELMQFLDMLTSLKPVAEKNGNGEPRLFGDLKAYNNCKDNLGKFKSYILHNWIPNHLSVEEELVFENIPTDITEINKHLINAINMIGTNHKKDLMSREVGLDLIERNAENVYIDRDIYTMVSPNDPKFVKANKISDIFNQPSNYSYGDLLLMIDKYETYFESGDDRKFTDAIKIYYTILLFETMFFDSTMVKYDKPKDNNDLNDLVIPIQKLIGGTVYYPNYFEIIKDKYFNQKGPSFDAKRAFYHKLPVEEKTVGDKYPFFAVLYYGDIRPDRYDTNHIYDTTFNNNADIDGTKYVTFDILSILSNMLNPWHTYHRADGNVKEVIDNSWESKIRKWGTFCEIKSKEGKGSILIPNSILPFYSVDMMLNYLKESIEVSKIIKEKTMEETNNKYDVIYKKYDEIKIKGRRNLLFTKDTSIKDSLKNLMIIIIEAQIVYLINNNNLSEDNKKNLLELLENDSIDQLKALVEKLSDDDKGCFRYDDRCSWFDRLFDCYNKTTEKDNNEQKTTQKGIQAGTDKKEPLCKEIIEEIEKLLKKLDDNLSSNDLTHLVSYIEILLESLEKKWELLKNKSEGFLFEDITNNYLNDVISILLEKYPESQKERDSLIKELHKYSTPSEIFKHLVESLWDNKMTEICIRSNIQEKVRQETSVDNYYNILWNKTYHLLNIDADDAIPIYFNIYNKAAKTFITKEHKCPMIIPNEEDPFKCHLMNCPMRNSNNLE